MPEAEPKATVQAKKHLQIHRRIQNPSKHLKWSKQESPVKTTIAWNYFPNTLEYV